MSAIGEVLDVPLDRPRKRLDLVEDALDDREGPEGWLTGQGMARLEAAAEAAGAAPDAAAALVWADLAQSLSARARRGRAVNLDPASLLMDMVLKIDETAASRFVNVVNL